MLNLGAGSTWPGEIALKLNKNFISEVAKANKFKIIIIAGTNGKTTTTTLLRFLLGKTNIKSFQNEEGANLLNGIASALIKNLSSSGTSNHDFAVFEVDENTLPLILKEAGPYAVILLNLFRDQLDRYGEVNTIANKWRESIKKLNKETFVILNGDDPQVSFAGKNISASTYYFGVGESLATKKEIPHDVDSIYCPSCSLMLKYSGIVYSHLGKYKCLRCGFTNPRILNYDFDLPLKGIYNKYNANAVFVFLDQVLHLPLIKIKENLSLFKPAFGRQEEIIYKKRKIHLLLSKNPTGFNQSIEAIDEINQGKKASLLLVLNDRIPDGRDISWIWDVEFEKLESGFSQIIASGDRCFDMGLRLKYSEVKNFKVEEDLKKAVEEIVDKTKVEEKIVVLATYTGMLEVREILTGRKLL